LGVDGGHFQQTRVGLGESAHAREASRDRDGVGTILVQRWQGKLMWGNAEALAREGERRAVDLELIQRKALV
jgi:hypothetical protein